MTPGVVHCSAAVYFRLQNSDKREISVFFGIIESIADNEFIRNNCADIIRLDVCRAAVRLIKQSAETNALRLAGLQAFQEYS